MSSYGKRFGANVRRFREGRGWSQDDLGRRIGMGGCNPGATISHYELGRREPTLRTIAKIARALDVDAGQLLVNVIR